MVRYREVSRLEGFSDAVFGFALTLLVVSLETPNDFAALKNMVYGFLPFALMFAMVCWIWYEHNVFFRRYGLQDPWTVFLNAVLLFVVLFYVYPLRFLTTALVGLVGGMPEGTYASFDDMDGSLLMTLYSTGVLVIFGAFLLLYRHAWQQRARPGAERDRGAAAEVPGAGARAQRRPGGGLADPGVSTAAAARVGRHDLRPHGAASCVERLSRRRRAGEVESHDAGLAAYFQRNSLSPAVNAATSQNVITASSNQTPVMLTPCS